MGLEYFELKRKEPTRYSFLILDENGKPESKISLIADEVNDFELRPNKSKTVNQTFRLEGDINNDQKVYETYSEEPSYDKVRNTIKAILEAKQAR